MPASLDILPPEIAVPTCCGKDADPAHGTKFHFSLNVSDMERSIAFYRVLFGVPPAKHHRDYAKFELTQPPLVFSLVPNPPSTGGALSHFGFPVSTVEEVDAVGQRLSAAGLDVSCQRGTVCGYARQDKVWVADPDHNYWEIYVVFEDVDPESARSGFDGVPPRAAGGSCVVEAPPLVGLSPVASPEKRSAAIWEHRVMEPLPERIPHADGSLDVVRLEGTFNADFTPAARARLLEQALRALRPGGEVQVHGLVADRPIVGGLPALPGVAALVRRIPVEPEPLQELAAAGFHGLRVTKLPQSPVFRSGEIEMREIKLSGVKPAAVKQAAAGLNEASRFVLYKGPFAEAADDLGNVYPRGRRVAVTPQAWDELGRSAAAAQFLFVGDPARDDAACS